MLNHLHVPLHAIQLLQAPVQRLQLLQQRRAVLGVRGQRGLQLPRQERQLICERVPQQREFLRGVQVLGCLLARPRDDFV